MEQIEERLIAVAKDVFDRPDLVFRRELNAEDVEEWDSLSHVSFVVAVEKEFGLRFSLAEIKPLKNLGEFADLIRRRSPEA